MSEKPEPEVEDMSFTGTLLLIVVGGLIVLSVALVYVLGLAWLLSLLAPLTFLQATILAVIAAGSTLLIGARIPAFDVPIVLIGLVVGAILAVTDVLLARLVAWPTPLSVWEASLLVAAITALSLFLFSQIVANGAAENETIGDWDDDDLEPALHRLSPDMYLLKPRFGEKSAPKRRRTSRKLPEKKSDDTETD